MVVLLFCVSGKLFVMLVLLNAIKIVYYFLFRLGTHVSVPFRINFHFVGITTG